MVNEYNPTTSRDEFLEWIKHLRSYLWYKCRLEIDIVPYRTRKNINRKRYQKNKPL